MPSSLEYADYLKSWLIHGYETRLLGAELPEKWGTLYLRHDIDFDCDLALQIARIEREVGMRSTFFFLLASDSYNLLSPLNKAAVQQISAMGHKVSLHFDPTIYHNVHAGLAYELDIFQKIFNCDVDIISIHRPAEVFMNNSGPIGGVSHTYQRQYIDRITYFSDSGGMFDYGDPFGSDQFRSGRSIQLLLHPIWWLTPSSQNPQQQLIEFLKMRTFRFASHIKANCKSFDYTELGEQMIKLL